MVRLEDLISSLYFAVKNAVETFLLSGCNCEENVVHMVAL